MKRNILSIALIACGIAVQAQEGWSLRQCIDYAIEHNINIRKAANAVDQSEVDVNTAKWARLPNLTGSGRQSWNWGLGPVRKPTTDENGNSSYVEVYENKYSANSSLSLSTSIPVFTGFQIPNQQELSKLNLKAAIADLEKGKEDIALNVASSYLQVLFNQELKKVAIGQVVLSKEQWTRIVRLAELGKASAAQVAEAKARVAQDEMSATQADNNYQLALLDLTQLLELPSPKDFYLSQQDTAIVFGVLTPPDDIYTESLMNRPGIRAAQFRLEGSEKSIKIAQSGLYPTLEFWGNMGTNYTNPFEDRFKTQVKNNFGQSIGLSLNIPIFNRFATRNRVRTAKLQQLNLALDLDNAKKAMYKDIQQAWYSAVAAESKFNSSVVAVEANEESFRLMNEKFDNGKATSVEYNESKQNLMKALSDRIQAKYEYLFRTKILDFYKGIPIE